MQQLYITEKPSVCRALADVIGGGKKHRGYIDCGDIVVSHCIGHLFEQEPPDHYLPDDLPTTKSGAKIWRLKDLPIIPRHWDYAPKAQTRDQLDVLKSLITKAKLIVNCADADREGSLIVDQLIEWSGSTVPVKRLWISALDDASIKRGLANLKDNQDYVGWTKAAIARHRADWLIGMNLTRVYTLAEKRSGGDRLLTVGRVQTPTLSLVVERDHEFENHKPVDHYSIDAVITHTAGAYTAKYKIPKEGEGVDVDGRLIDRAVAERVCQEISQCNGVISVFKHEKKSQPHPLGLCLADLTLIASNRYGHGADAVLKGAQTLYEHKLTSYPRSDCTYLPESQHADAPDILAAIAATRPDITKAGTADADPSIKARIFNDAKITAHHAIIPTAHQGDIETLSTLERQLYEIIALNYLAQFYPAHEYLSTKVTATVADHRLTASGKVVVNNGWKAIYIDAEKKNNEPVQTIPMMAQGDRVKCGKGKVTAKKTKPPKRYTDGTLVKAMENIHLTVTDTKVKALLREGDGIGTSATRATIISELKRRKFLRMDGKYIVSTEDGRELIATLPAVVTTPALTAHFERLLVEIQKGGETTLEAFTGAQEKFVTTRVNDVITSLATVMQDEGVHACVECGAEMTRRRSQYGKGYWWACTGYPVCRATADDVEGKPVARESMPAQSVSSHQCKKCGSGLMRRASKKSAGYWWGCTGFPKCKETYRDKKGTPVFNNTSAAQP